MCYFSHILHLQGDDFIGNDGCMWAVYGDKTSFSLNDAEISCKTNETSSAIATHSPNCSIRIIINHAKIIIIGMLKQHQSIRPDAETPMAELGDLFLAQLKKLISVVKDNKIITRSLVFEKPHAYIKNNLMQITKNEASSAH